MRNPLQDQLLKAGLVKKDKVAKAVREQNKRLHAKGPADALSDPDQIDTAKLAAERAERDRALAAARNAQAKANELKAQVRQIVDAHKIKREGEIDYRFNDGDVIRSVLVNDVLRGHLAKGVLVIVRHGDGYELVPRAAAEKIRERDGEVIVLDHRCGDDGKVGEASADDEYYSRFQVPDDLIW